MKEEGLVMTRYEKEIYDMINASAEHLTVEQVFANLKKRYPKVVLATVYNNLNKLWEAGLIRKVSVEGMPDRYDWMEKHDHLVCKQCGKLMDIAFEDLTVSLNEQLGEEFLFYDLKVFHLCSECRKKQNNK